MANRLLAKARSYLGVRGGSKTHQSIVDGYNAKRPRPVGYAVKYYDNWCDTFVTFISDQVGATPYIGRECGVQRHVNIFKQLGIWLGRQRPKAGDVIVFDWENNGWADHIGFVEKVTGNQVVTIEGNSNNAVRRNTYPYNAWYIKGYARPQYPKEAGKSAETLAKEVLDRKWGNGNDRVRRLQAAGYDSNAVQKAVNALVAKRKQKSLLSLAQEVLAGKWGNGQARVKALREAGYNPVSVQKEVNRLLGH